MLRAQREAQAKAKPAIGGLTTPELARLAVLENAITQGLGTFVEVGAALMEVRDARLYRGQFSTFEDYCQQRWSLSRPRAYQMLQATNVAANLSTVVDTPAPKNEAQTRPLTRLEPEQQREAWQQAVETAPLNGDGEPHVTAAHVENVVREFEGRPKMAVHYSSDTPEWLTPLHIIQAVAATLGEIDLDPCSNEGTPNVPAHRHFTVADNGLEKDWTGRVYMNPPYGDAIPEWTGKLIREFRRGRVTEAVALVPARTDTKWFSDLYDCAICFVRGRLKFSESETGAPFPSAAVYFGIDARAFAKAFADTGTVVVRYEQP